MASRTVSVIAIVLLAPALAAAAAAPRPEPKTITLVRGSVKAVAQDGPWVAWGSSDADVTVRRFTRPKRFAFRSAGLGEEPLPMALAGGRVLWVSYESGNNTYEDVNLAMAGRRGVRTVSSTEYDNAYYGGTFVGGIAGDGATLVYSTVTVNLDCPDDGWVCTRYVGGGRVWRIDGARKIQIEARPSFQIAASGSRIALVALPRNVRLPHDGRVEIREVRGGRLVASFDPAGTVRALGLSSKIVALVVATGATQRLAWFDARTGAAAGTMPLTTAREAPSYVSVSGYRVLFSVDRRIQLLDTRTQQIATLAVTRRRPVSPSIEGSRVVWAEQARGGFAIRELRLR